MIAAAIWSSVLLGQLELDEKLVQLREELRRTLTNGTLMLAQAKSQKDQQRIYEQGFTALTKIVTDATTFESASKSLDQKAKFGLVRYEATASMIQDPSQVENLTKSLIVSYRESTTICQPVEELLFYRYLDASAHESMESWLSEAKSAEVKSSAALARILRSLVNLEGDQNLLRSLGQQYPNTKAGKRAMRIFNLRTKLALGQPMPELEMSLIGGSKLKVSNLKGKIVIIDFWGFWSAASNGERSELKKLAKDHSSKVQIVGVNTDDWNVSFLQSKIKSEGITWPSHAAGLPSAEIPLDYGITEYPAKIIVDPQGIVRFLPGLGNWRDAIEKLLASDKKN
jgi:thiol-disulfide isomerase/thioredoxin